MNKKFGYNEDGTMKTWLAVSFSALVFIMVIGGILSLVVDMPPSDSLLEKPYTSVMGDTLTLNDSLLYASYGFTKEPTISGMKEFRNIDLDWSKMKVGDTPKEVKARLGGIDGDLSVYEADVDESLNKDIKVVRHYVVVKHTFKEPDMVVKVLTYVKGKNGNVKVLSLEDSVRFTTAYLVTRGK